MIFSQRSDTYVKEIDHSLTGLHGFCPAPGLRLVRLPEAGVSLGVGTKEQYAEAKVLPRTTIGYKRADRDQYGNQNDIYAKYNVIGLKVQLLGGWRNQHRRTVELDVLLRRRRRRCAASWAPAHATHVKGSHFGQPRPASNYNIAFGWGLNVNYRNYMPGRRRQRTRRRRRRDLPF